MDHEHTSWSQSVTAVVIEDHKVLLARHSYGAGAGKLIIPGGYCGIGESPVDAVKREYLEETKVVIEPKDIIGIRTNSRDWYLAFRGDYVSGDPVSDMDENSEVLWIDVDDALMRDDVPSLTKDLIKCALSPCTGLVSLPYEASIKYDSGLLFGTPGTLSQESASDS